MVIILIFKFLIFSSQVPIDEKSHQWFGATVASSGEDGVVVVSFDNDYDNVDDHNVMTIIS